MPLPFQEHILLLSKLAIDMRLKSVYKLFLAKVIWIGKIIIYNQFVHIP